MPQNPALGFFSDDKQVCVGFYLDSYSLVLPLFAASINKIVKGQCILFILVAPVIWCQRLCRTILNDAGNKK